MERDVFWEIYSVQLEVASTKAGKLYTILIKAQPEYQILL
jgi:hypothetical protein